MQRGRISQRRLFHALGAVALFGATAQACGGDGLMTSSGTTGGETTSSAGGTGGMGTGGSGTGGVMQQADHGPPATAFVNAGERTKSGKYVMDYTLGQSTQNLGRSQSPGYVVQGGLVGANGSFK